MSSNQGIRALVVGATGTVGSHLINEFIKPRYKNKIYTTILARSSTIQGQSQDSKKNEYIKKWRDHGVEMIEGDLMNENVNTLVEKLTPKSGKSYDVLFSTVGSKLKKEGQLKLIDIAKQAHIPWYIPSEYGYQYETIGRNSPAFWFDTNIDIRDAIRKASLEYTFIETGFLTEYLLSPYTGIDLQNRKITAPVSLNNKVTTTTLHDTAVYVAHMLLKKETAVNQEVLLYSDTLTYSDIADLLEQHYKETFERKEKSLGELKEEQKKGDEKEAVNIGFQLVIASQHGTYWEPSETWNYQHLKDYQPTNLKAWLSRNQSKQ